MSIIRYNATSTKMKEKFALPPKADHYDPPYSADDIIRIYGRQTYLKLSKDPAHKFRMDTGIELIHKEPSKTELVRICSNWQAMSLKMKQQSDIESMHLFGVKNLEHYMLLIQEY